MLTDGTYLADRYEILNRIGAGGMSDVYKAKDHILGRFVAVKILKAEFSEDRSFVSKFRTEAQSAAGLEHPNIVNIYDVGSEGGLHYIVMEYVEGITLKTYIEKKGQLTFKESVSIAIQVARGIEAAHNKQIIHRDIKPQNIMISTEGKVKVMDFGIAKAASSNTISSDVMGSVHYSSPEQARNGFVDGRSDIYSLGIVMYEMVTGRVPFDGDTTVAVAIQHLQEEIPNPGEYTENLPISMEKIILKCTQKNPDRRYQNIRELMDDLRRALVNPEEDFVVIAPAVDNSKTKVISDEELWQIKDRGAESAADGAVLKGETDRGEDEDEDESDDSDERLSPRMDKAVTIMGIAIAVVILVVIIYLLGSVFNLFRLGKPDNSKNGTESEYRTESESGSESESETESESEPEHLVEVPQLVNRSQEDGLKMLDALGLNMFVIAVEKSDKEAGTILEQDIAAFRSVPRGTTVKVILAGAENIDYMGGGTGTEVEVPSVVGLIEAEAVNAITDQDLQPIKRYEYNDVVDAGRVISQDPVQGSSVQPKTKVTIVISQGRKSVRVPNVLDQGRDSAVAMLTEAGLIVTVNEDYHDTVEAGIVFEQSVAGEKAVPEGSKITITVSIGPKERIYSYSGSFMAPEDAVSVSYTLVGSDGVLYDIVTDMDVYDSLTIEKEDLRCGSGTLTLAWVIVSVDDEGLPETSTYTESYNVEFTEQ